MIQKYFWIINFTNSLVRVLENSLIRLKNYRNNIFTKVYLSSKKPTKSPKLLFDLIMDQLFLVLQHQKGSHSLFLQGLLQYASFVVLVVKIDTLPSNERSKTSTCALLLGFP